MNKPSYPALPYKDWEQTKITLHLFSQIVGKIRLRMHPRVNHWWHAPLYVSPRGLTTAIIPHGGSSFDMEFDFIDHDLVIRTSSDFERRLSLRDKSVAGFYGATMQALDDAGIEAHIVARPFDPSKASSDIPFAEDTTHKTYDASAVQDYWQALVGIEGILQEFRGRFVGKCSPVHLFWHSFDLAVTRFSGRPAELPPDADPVTKDAYSHEVSSVGFWPGDPNLPEAAFYAYSAPEPKGLADEPIRPSRAWWQDMEGSHMGLYKYEDFRNTADPRASLLEFLQSTFDAGARRAAWPSDLQLTG